MSAARASTSVLVTWVSVGHRAAPIITALTDRKSPAVGAQRLYICWRDAPSPDGDDERAALRTTERELRDQIGAPCPPITKLPWKTSASPTDHGEIRGFAEGVLQRVREEHPDAVIVVHLSPGTPAMHAVWLVLGTTSFIAGPVQLIQTTDGRNRAAGRPAVQTVELDLDTWLRRYRAARPRQVATDDDGHVWDPARVKSAALREALGRLQEWAPLRAPVLLVGERGTGKTTLANFLRAMSPYQGAGKVRSTWPTVVCGQFRVNPQLARSELFGHMRGAFTGATSDRKGLLEEADGDSIFFDELADIDRDTQRLLMAAVEGRGFQRLGDAKTRQSRFRLICATNRSLAELRGQHLDLDFYDRVAVFVLTVPPLRQCREDLPEAWRLVLTAATRAADVSPAGWQQYLEHPDLLGAITAHPLPGNFRDLQRAAYHLLAGLAGDRRPTDALAGAVDGLGPREQPRSPDQDVGELAGRLPVADLRVVLADQERAWIKAALDRARGNKAAAARLLGIPRKTFDDRIKALARADG